jgi:hypothetical protein
MVGKWSIIYPFSEQVDTIQFFENQTWEGIGNKLSDYPRKPMWELQNNSIHLQFADKRDPNTFDWKIISQKEKTIEVIQFTYNNGENKPIETKLILHKIEMKRPIKCLLKERY